MSESVSLNPPALAPEPKASAKGLTIYKSSAGSGKTYTLVKEYLAIVLENPTDYRHTLAITFTNKATQEMKTRIVKALGELAEGKSNSMKDDLQKLLPEVNIQQHAGMALDMILHDYSRFSILTIDSFFQRIIRSLAREIHLPIRFDLELDQESVVDSVTESLLEEAGNDADLNKWLRELVLMKMEDDKGWKVEEDIKWVANELFTENFPEHTLTISRETIRKAIVEMRTMNRGFTQQMVSFGKEALRIIDSNGLSETDFFQGGRGVIGFFRKISSAEYKNAEVYLPNSYVEAAFRDNKWASSKTADKRLVESVATQHLHPILNNIYSLLETGFGPFVTSQEVLKYIYITGIMSDLSKHLGNYRSEKNLVFISDAPKILNRFLTAGDTSFVYEKFGTTFRHFLIDEFQDTSTLQWKNIIPLIAESMGSGHFSLVVGDVKQSIYRWRGGNMQLLNNIKKDFPGYSGMIREKNLSTNFRSKKMIVDFNNEFFSAAAEAVNKHLELTDKNISTVAYKAEEVSQGFAEQHKDGGFIRVKLFNTEKTEGQEIKWKDKALKELTATIHALFEKGFEPKDISILVRKNQHGNDIALHLFENGIKKVISPDSLLLESSVKINFLLSVLQYLADQSDQVAKTEVIYAYARYKLNKDANHELFTLGEYKKRKKKEDQSQSLLFDEEQLKDSVFNKVLPAAFTHHLMYLSKLPLYELVEQLISIFSLNEKADAYLQRFQDVVLEQVTKKNFGISGFLQWWSENNENYSVIVPENENAITIMTIHKAKGLQFPVVFIPWMDWTLGPGQQALLWVTSETKPFNTLGMIPVRPTKALKHTDFKSHYEDELISNYIDNLNLMYVAMTRPEQQLYIYCENLKEGELKNVGHVVKRVAGKSAVLKPVATAGEEETFEAGMQEENKNKKLQETAVPLNTYLINRWQEKISISSKARELKEITNTDRRKKIDFGILVHRILSEIKNKEEIEAAASRILQEGIITVDEVQHLKEELANYFSIEGIELFYNDQWKVMNEREIMLPGGDVLRPDRILIKDKEAMVIDFKTGAEKSSHKEQVLQYAATLQSMGVKNVKSYLVYINDKRIVEVA